MKNTHIIREKLDINKSKILGDVFSFLNQKNKNSEIEKILSNPESLYLDPDMGGGQFISELIKDQRSRGFSDENISKRIFGFSSDILALNYAVKKGNLIGNFEILDFISLEVRNNKLFFTIKNKKYSMDFDIILGNPPYQGDNKKSTVKLWHRFIRKSRNILKENGYLCFIVPSSFKNFGIHSNVGEGAKIFNECMTTKNLVSYQDKGKAFEGMGIEVCHFLEQNKPYEGKTLFNGEIIDLREKDSTQTEEEKIMASVISKVIENNLPRLPLKMIRRLKEKCNTEGVGFPVYFSGSKRVWVNESINFPGERNEGILEHGSLKLVFPHSSSYKNQFITTDAVCTLNHYLNIESEEEGIQIMSYTKDPLFVKIASVYKRTSGFTPLVLLKMIPSLERKNWESDSLYKFFNLTEQEIEWVKS
jgi:hypothetical protein